MSKGKKFTHIYGIFTVLIYISFASSHSKARSTKGKAGRIMNTQVSLQLISRGTIASKNFIVFMAATQGFLRYGGRYHSARSLF